MFYLYLSVTSLRLCKSIGWLQDGQFFVLASRLLCWNHWSLSKALMRSLITAARSSMLAMLANFPNKFFFCISAIRFAPVSLSTAYFPLFMFISRYRERPWPVSRTTKCPVNARCLRSIACSSRRSWCEVGVAGTRQVCGVRDGPYGVVAPMVHILQLIPEPCWCLYCNVSTWHQLCDIAIDHKPRMGGGTHINTQSNIRSNTAKSALWVIDIRDYVTGIGNSSRAQYNAIDTCA